MPIKKSFAEKVYLATQQIPAGKVATYAQIAHAIGRPRASRAVGNALNKNPNPYPDLALRSFTRRRDASKLVPCHRVVRSDGSLGGFASGAKKKQVLLAKEGVVVKGGKIDLKNCHCRV